MFTRSLALGAALLLSACVSSTPPENASPFMEELPEGLAEVADPSQNLGAVLILPEDNCYWYQHTNAVESTYLPLLTRDGRPICSQPRT
jgi:hypothetical protein